MPKKKTRVLEALSVAQNICTLISAYCVRTEILGSIRRYEQFVGDIEILAEPKIIRQPNLFGELSPVVNIQPIKAMLKAYGGVFVKGKDRHQTYQIEDIQLDLFLNHPPAQWGVNKVLRTGPKEFSQWIVTVRKERGAMPSNCRMEGAAVYLRNDLIPMPTEQDYLDFLGLGWIPPQDRKPGFPIKPLESVHATPT
jgi:DNA polymerase/3'-5' exonuclease PolX